MHIVKECSKRFCKVSIKALKTVGSLGEGHPNGFNEIVLVMPLGTLNPFSYCFYDFLSDFGIAVGFWIGEILINKTFK